MCKMFFKKEKIVGETGVYGYDRFGGVKDWKKKCRDVYEVMVMADLVEQQNQIDKLALAEN